VSALLFRSTVIQPDGLLENRAVLCEDGRIARHHRRHLRHRTAASQLVAA
jgi:hypothetical protein